MGKETGVKYGYLLRKYDLCEGGRVRGFEVCSVGVGVSGVFQKISIYGEVTMNQRVEAGQCRKINRLERHRSTILMPWV